MSTPAAPLSRQPDADPLERALRARVAGEVRFDRGTRAAYSADASNYRQVPIGVVVPRTVEDLVTAVALCRSHGAPLLARGGGTSQCGQCVNVAVVIDTSKYLNRVLSIDARAGTAEVEPGVVCDALRDAAEQHGLTFGPDPATHSRCTLGGMIGNNSCGAHSVMAGKTVENIEALEILTYDGLRMRVGPTPDAQLEAIIRAGGRRGEIYSGLKRIAGRYGDLIRARFPKIKRRVSGYNLDQLLPENGFNVARALVGSEGTCALTLAATARLVASPRHRVILVLGFPDIYQAGDAAPHVASFRPIAIEGLDERIIGGMRARSLRLADIARLPQGRAWLMVEFGADTPEAAGEQALTLVRSYEGKAGAPATWLITDPKLAERIWTVREVGATETQLSIDPRSRDASVGWEDAAVDPLRLGDYLRDFQRLIDRHGYTTSLYGHFGDGCIHARVNFDLRTRAGVATWRGFLREAAELVVKYGGSLSGEHGDGQGRAEFLPVMYGEELMQAFREFKRVWDPDNRMNPGKLIDAYRVDDNLRLGPDYNPWRPATQFAFSSREGDGFARAIERCVGMGKCRSASGGVMCPSYRATGDERHSTRGRARLFSEMLRGEVITDRWESAEVREALDLCLACKGCRNDCPTHTDMASYKAEFLSHHYAGRLRPRHAYSMGWIRRWAGAASAMPRLVNWVTHIPGLDALVKMAAGIAPERELPRFASETFVSRFHRSADRSGQDGDRRVILWPDTFNNHFHPETAVAATGVLEAAGYHVSLPPAGLCCGRPLYDFGMLDLARRHLLEIMEKLESDIRAGTPVIALEPACASVFRDELLNLFPQDDRARRLSRQVVLFGDFLAASGWQPARIGGRAVVHGHCHHKAVFGMAGDLALLDRLGIECAQPEAGCCGMSGSFGFHPERYALSMKLAEQALLPAVRRADSDTYIIADGYSCREQIAQGSSRRALHIAEVASLALKSVNRGS